MLGWELPPHNSGGLGVACYHLAKALAFNGTSIDFVLPYTAEHPDTGFMRILSISQRTSLEKYGAYNDSSDSLRQVQSEYVDFVVKQVATTQYDAIHAHDWLTMEAGMVAKQASGTPLIVHVHATEFDRAGSRHGNPLIEEIEQQGLLMADRIIAVSAITKALIMQHYHIPADKIDVLHNAFDPGELTAYSYDGRTYRYLEVLRHEGYTIVSAVARFTVQKGLMQLLEGFAKAMQKYPKMALLLAGDGELRRELIERAAELGVADSVYFTGFVRGKQWRDAYSVSDVFVLSSISEPFGLTALEAAHHGAALILTKQSGVGEVVDSVLRYDFWDTDRLADQLVGIAANRALLDELQTGARREYARLSWHDVALRCLQLYRQPVPKGLLS